MLLYTQKKKKKEYLIVLARERAMPIKEYAEDDIAEATEEIGEPMEIRYLIRNDLHHPIDQKQTV